MTVRIPLHIKLMVSYLLVVGLVLLPTAIYLRTSLANDLRTRARLELEQELSGICARLAETPTDQLVARTSLLLTALPTRLTVVDVEGNVLGDSVHTGRRADNHRDRPEIRDAMRDGEGTSVRHSATTGHEMLYVAMRFPRTGVARGVARLAREERSINAAGDQVGAMVRGASAVALSAAVLLSLVAALAASRPLRRIASRARAFAAGDFGARIDVSSNDEIGEVADALTEMAAQLRARLLTSGADRATLQALVDDLPVGVVLYDPQRRPVSINGAARTLCGLAPYAEVERGAELARLDGQPAAIARVLRDGLTDEVPLVLPWKPDAALAARWLAVFAPDGARLPALVVVDRSDDRALGALRAALAGLVGHVRALSVDAEPSPLTAAAARGALTAEELLSPPEPLAEAVGAVSLRALYEAAVDDVAALAASSGAGFELDANDAEARVVDVDGRARRALRAILRWAVERGGREASITVMASASERGTRISVRGPATSAAHAPELAQSLRPFGGDAGLTATDDGADCWMLLPRA